MGQRRRGGCFGWLGRGRAEALLYYLQSIVERELGELVLDRVCYVVELGQERKGLQPGQEGGGG